MDLVRAPQFSDIIDFSGMTRIARTEIEKWQSIQGREHQGQVIWTTGNLPSAVAPKLGGPLAVHQLAVWRVSNGSGAD